MALLERLRKTPTKKAAAPTKEVSKVKKASEGAASDVGSTVTPVSIPLMLKKPHVSEKAARFTAQGVYVFVVPISAEKVSIRKAVEATYKVKVEGVRTVRLQGKPVMRGRRPGMRSATKRAIVTLKKGQTIDIYKGV